MNLIKQMTAPVQWESTINNMINDGVSYFLELGPQSILSKISKKINETTTFYSFEELAHNESI